MTLLGKKTFCAVTGASRGIGKAIAIAISKNIAVGSCLLLMARNEKMLQEVRSEILETTSAVNVLIRSFDFAEMAKDAYDTVMKEVLKSVSGPFELALLVHNAASIGPIHMSALSLTSSSELRHYFDVNLFSTIILNSVFFSHFNEKLTNQRAVVNVSSGAAYRGIPSLHLYSAGKAAREAFFRGLASEEPTIRVLNFNPGPVVTDMQREIFNNTYSSDIKEWSRSGMQSGSFPDSEFVAGKLIKYLKEDNFESGVFYDAHDKKLVFDYQEISD